MARCEHRARDAEFPGFEAREASENCDEVGELPLKLVPGALCDHAIETFPGSIVHLDSVLWCRG